MHDGSAPAPDVVALIHREIAAAGGAISFDRYMELALYADGGFYTTNSAGRRGDFITSAEVGPLFGAVICRFLVAEWERLGRPDPFEVVEVGAGPGTLARAIEAASRDRPPAFVDAMRYRAVEISAAQRERHPEWVHSTAAVPERIAAGVVIANELLDNLPVRIAVYDGAWREAFVVSDTTDRFAEVLGAPLDPVPAVLPPRPAHGARAPLMDAAADWIIQTRARVERGTLVVFDYVTARTAELVMRPYRDWLRTYRAHERGAHPLRDTGEQDITCQVALDQLPEPDTVRSQAQWLQRWGITALVDEGRAYWDGARSNPDLAALRMRSRINEAEALLDPHGLGAFTVLEWRCGDDSHLDEHPSGRSATMEP